MNYGNPYVIVQLARILAVMVIVNAPMPHTMTLTMITVVVLTDPVLAMIIMEEEEIIDGEVWEAILKRAA